MPQTIRFHETGDAGVLKIEDLPLEEPGKGEVRFKVEAISLNRVCRQHLWDRFSSGLRECFCSS